MLENIFNVVSFVGAVQGVFLAVILLRKKGNHPATRSLAAYTFIFSVGLLEPYLEQTLHGWGRSAILSFLSISNLLYGPLLYLFVYFLTAENPRFRKQEWYHFLPFAMLFGIDRISSFFGRALLAIDAVQLAAFELLIIQMVTYNVLAIRRLAHHRQRVLTWYANVEIHDLKWLRFFLIWITAIYAMSFTVSHILLLGWPPAADLYLLVQLGITLSIFMMTYRMILQPQVFAPVKGEAIKSDKSEALVPKYVKSGLKQDQADEYLRLLVRCMESDKPYLDPGLTIYSLSEKLGISRNHLTQVINENAGKNFYEYVNEYRVEEVKRRIQDPEYSHLSLAGIGLDAGFKSKSAFNINFKKITGFTPTEWKRRTTAASVEKNV